MKLDAVSFDSVTWTSSACESCFSVSLHLWMKLNAEKTHNIERQIKQTNLQTW